MILYEANARAEECVVSTVRSETVENVDSVDVIAENGNSVKILRSASATSKHSVARCWLEAGVPSDLSIHLLTDAYSIPFCHMDTNLSGVTPGVLCGGVMG